MTTITTATHASDRSSFSLADAIDRVFIIAYKESTEKLEAALTHEGFSCEVIRQQDSPETANFSPSYRFFRANSRNQRAEQLFYLGFKDRQFSAPAKL